jgi:acyl-CoA synthetase (AMP-forming)/AMP-acid ligase II
VAVVEIGATGEPVARTYGELLGRTELFAAALADCGLGRADRIVVDAVNGAAAIAMLMACSMVGAAFVPLTPEVPDERARQIVGLARPHGYVHLTDTGRIDRLTSREDIGVVAFSWDGSDPAPVRRAAADRVETSPGGDPIAYLIFTSGSTGVPKGVAMSQRATSAFFDAIRGLLRPTDRVASTAPLQFDFSLLDIGACLANRSAIVPIPRTLLRWPRQFVGTLAATGSTRVHAVPSVWRPLLRREPHLLADLPPLDAVMFSGESFPPGELAVLHEALPATRVVNCYGPTECMACSFTDVTGFADGSTAGLPIDGAYPGSSLGIIDDDGVPIDEPGRSGQIRFVGPSVFAGYWTPEGTLCRPPSVRRPAAGPPSLLTGDYAHLGHDGRLYFDGRRDRQVKVAGNRVELVEIEATLSRVPGVDEARIVVETHDGSVSLVAFVAGPAGDGDARAEACRQLCVDRLPQYMRPAKVVHLPYLPKSANGKVDQHRLVQEAAQL